MMIQRFLGVLEEDVLDNDNNEKLPNREDEMEEQLQSVQISTCKQSKKEKKIDLKVKFSDRESMNGLLYIYFGQISKRNYKHTSKRSI